MTIKPIKEKPRRSIEIDLTGPEGNVFFLIARAKEFSRQMGLDGDAITQEMISGDYENAVSVFDREFGSFVTLYR